MREYEVVGFRQYSGEFEGRKYSGYYVHTLVNPDKDGFNGRMCKELKVKSKLGYTPRIGDVINVYYDEYGICDIQVVY